MNLSEAKWVAEIPMLPGESIVTLDSQLSEFFGMLAVVALQQDGRLACCGFLSQEYGEAFVTLRKSLSGHSRQ